MRQVVDASVLLAYILGEPGGDLLVRDDGPFDLSVVNYAEVLSKIGEREGAEADAERVLHRLPIELHDVDRDDALRVGRLRPLTSACGLSLGDRICLALGQRLKLPVATAERIWARLDLGIDIRLIR